MYGKERFLATLFELDSQLYSVILPFDSIVANGNLFFVKEKEKNREMS